MSDHEVSWPWPASYPGDKPVIRRKDLHIAFPRTPHIPCPRKNCDFRAISFDWVIATHILGTHLQSEHGYTVRNTTTWCARCTKPFVTSPSAHRCFTACSDALLDSNSEELLPCIYCGDAFPTEQKFRSHIAWKHAGTGLPLKAFTTSTSEQSETHPPPPSAEGEHTGEFSSPPRAEATEPTKESPLELLRTMLHSPENTAALCGQPGSPVQVIESDGNYSFIIPKTVLKQWSPPVNSPSLLDPLYAHHQHDSQPTPGDTPHNNNAESSPAESHTDASTVTSTTVQHLSTPLDAPSTLEPQQVKAQTSTPTLAAHSYIGDGYTEPNEDLPATPYSQVCTSEEPQNQPHNNITETPMTSYPPISTRIDCDWEELVQHSNHAHEGTLHIFFPIEPDLKCFVPECPFAAHAKTVSSTIGSLRKHILMVHSLQVTAVCRWCTHCHSPMGKHFAKHVCFLANDLVSPSPRPLTFQCTTCEFQARTKKGLLNHMVGHRRRSTTVGISTPPPTSVILHPSAVTIQPVQAECTAAGDNITHNTQPPILEPESPATSQQANTQAPVEYHSPSTPAEDANIIPLPAQEDVETDLLDTQEDIAHEISVREVEASIPDPTDLVSWPYWLPKPTEPLEGAPQLTLKHRDTLAKILLDPPTSESWNNFLSLIEAITQDIQDTVKLRIPNPQDKTTRKAKTEVKTDPVNIQKAYRKNRRRALRTVTEQPSGSCKASPEECHSFFSNVWPEASYSAEIYEDVHPIPNEVSLAYFSREEVLTKLSTAENSAPGYDRITYKHLQLTDPDATILTLIYNICIKFQKIPPKWKHSTTVLLPKDGEPSNLSNWRPIALSCTLYKLYAKCLTSRLTDWLITQNVLSPCQKGFLPFDGVFEHNFTLEARWRQAKQKKQDICIAFLDIKNAFGAIPHGALLSSLEAHGAGTLFTNIIKDIYTDATTAILCEQGTTEEINIRSGVKQGCPLSGPLFDIAVDPVVRKLQGLGLKHSVLAYADDLLLIADSCEEMGDLLRTAFDTLASINLQLKPAKCKTLHYSNATPAGPRNTIFHVDNHPIQALLQGDFHKFLGKPIGVWFDSTTQTLDDLHREAMGVFSSNLAPWQKLDAFQTFIYAKTQFPMRMGQVNKTAWTNFDTQIRKEVKSILNLPPHAANEYIYGPRSHGCCGVPSAAIDSDIALIDNAFKILTSPDPMVKQLAFDILKQALSEILGHEPSMAETEAYLSGSSDRKYTTATGRWSTIFSKAREASKRLHVFWSFANIWLPQLQVNDCIIYATHRSKVFRTLRNELRKSTLESLRKKPDQGKTNYSTALSKDTNHFILTGRHTRFAEWRFVHRARLNLLPLNACKKWKKNQDKRCRRCGKEDETLPHVLDHCMRYSNAYKSRHNCLHARVRTAAMAEWGILYEDQLIPGTQLKPDLVLIRDSEVLIVDFCCPFEGSREAFNAARAEKLNKYQPLLELFQKTYKSVSLHAFLVGSLGSWDPKNDLLLKKICSASYARNLRRLCISETLRWSRNIYVEFVTGHKQYKEDVPVVPPATKHPQENRRTTINYKTLGNPYSDSNKSKCNKPTNTTSNRQQQTKPPLLPTPSTTNTTAASATAKPSRPRRQRRSNHSTVTTQALPPRPRPALLPTPGSTAPATGREASAVSSSSQLTHSSAPSATAHNSSVPSSQHYQAPAQEVHSAPGYLQPSAATKPAVPVYTTAPIVHHSNPAVASNFLPAVTVAPQHPAFFQASQGIQHPFFPAPSFAPGLYGSLYGPAFPNVNIPVTSCNYPVNLPVSVPYSVNFNDVNKVLHADRVGGTYGPHPGGAACLSLAVTSVDGTNGVGTSLASDRVGLEIGSSPIGAGNPLRVSPEMTTQWAKPMGGAPNARP